MALTAPQPYPVTDDAALLPALRLIRSENVGPVTYHHLVSHYGSPQRALEALPELSRRGGRRKPVTICETANAEREIEATLRLGARFVLHPQSASASASPACAGAGSGPEEDNNGGYPPLLATIPDAPPVLVVLGQRVRWHEQSVIGMVGARNASANGCAMAKRLAHDLGQAGYLIASGLARGIDTAAQLGSLETGTIAVIAGGIDVIYPPENDTLYRDIAERGAIVAEAPLGTAPIARHFPARNRIIAGLSVGVAVIEASLKSGSLITAHDALDYGRDVFAAPGSPLDPRCKGSNDLLRHGAVLTESAQDILNSLNHYQPDMLREQPAAEYTGPPATLNEAELVRARREVLAKLGPEPVLLDELLAQCNISPSYLYMILLELEVAGRLMRHHGARVSLRMDG